LSTKKILIRKLFDDQKQWKLEDLYIRVSKELEESDTTQFRHNLRGTISELHRKKEIFSVKKGIWEKTNNS